MQGSPGAGPQPRLAAGLAGQQDLRRGAAKAMRQHPAQPGMRGRIAMSQGTAGQAVAAGPLLRVQQGAGMVEGAAVQSEIKVPDLHGHILA